MQKTMPDLSPLLAPTLCCHTCGTILQPKPILSRRGVEGIRYECHNAKTGCSYGLTVTTYVASELTPIRAPEKVTA